MICYEIALKQRSIFQIAIRIECTYSLRNMISVYPFQFWSEMGKEGAE